VTCSEVLARLAGAAVTAGFTAYYVSASVDACNTPWSVSVIMAFVCPTAAVVFALPRVQTGTYAGEGLSAAVGFAVGVAAGSRTETSVCEVIPASTLFTSFVVALLSVMGGFILLVLVRWLVGRRKRSTSQLS
jgi:hypothetical protein